MITQRYIFCAFDANFFPPPRRANRKKSDTHRHKPRYITTFGLKFATAPHKELSNDFNNKTSML